MAFIVRHVRFSRGRFLPPTRESGSETTQVLIVLVLFVAGLMTSGQNLVAAVTAAAVLSWSASYATRHRIEGVKA